MSKVTLGIGSIMLVVALVGTGWWSYVRTASRRALRVVAEHVSIEFEIERAQEMVEAMIPEIRKMIHVIAREEIEIEQLAGQISANADRLVEETALILRLKCDLGRGEREYAYGSNRFTPEQLQIELANRFERYKGAEAHLASLRSIVESRTQGLETARQKLTRLTDMKRQLTAHLEQLEARARMGQVAQTCHDGMGDAVSARVQGQIGAIRRRLDIAERVLTSETVIHQAFDANVRNPDELLAEIDRHFSPEHEMGADSSDRPSRLVHQEPGDAVQ
jgi:flagellar biosynthesis/type III secretory pathway chaperone